MQLVLVYVVIIVAIFYFMTTRGRKKQQTQQQMMREGLVIGAEARTIGGIVGEVVELTDEHVTLETTPGVKLKFVKSAIAGIIPPAVEEELVPDSDEQADPDEEQDAEPQDVSSDADRAAESANGHLAPAPFEAEEAEFSKK